MSERSNAIIVGAGPNGLAAAIRLARQGWSVKVAEAWQQPGGGLRTIELLEPGFRHDVCATVHALVPLSLAMSSLQVHLVTPTAALAHPLDDGSAVVVYQSIEETMGGLGRDAAAYRGLMAPFVKRAPELFEDLLGPVVHIPHHPLVLGRLGSVGWMSAYRFAKLAFRGTRARALFAGAGAHSMLSLHELATASFGLAMLISAHAGGWSFARRGSSTLAEVLASELRDAGGEIECERRVLSLDELPAAAAVILDMVPEGILSIAGNALPERYKRRLARYRYGPGAFKLDWTLDAPIPWKAAECLTAGTVHLGGTIEEIAFAEREVALGRHPDRPFVLLTQPSLFDDTRAPPGKHVAWAYCHVPNGSDLDMTERIEAQIERFAPGFRDVVRERFVWTPSKLEAHEINCIGGDINGGRQDLRQLIFRPVFRLNPYTTPNPRVFIASSATPPGGGVHGMCGWHAAGSVLRRFA